MISHQYCCRAKCDKVSNIAWVLLLFRSDLDLLYHNFYFGYEQGNKDQGEEAEGHDYRGGVDVGNSGHGRHQVLNNPGLTTYLCHYRSEEHTSELQSRPHLVCRLL